jgi:hypothetical protein
MLTLAEAQTLLGTYAGVGQNFQVRLNLTRERLLKAGNWSSTKAQVIFTAYPDANQQGFITLPREYSTVLAIAPMPMAGGRCFGYPLRTRGLWYEFAAGGVGVSANQTYGWQRGLVPIQQAFTTFADWSTPVTLQLQFETSEDAGLVLFRGTLDGKKIYSVINGAWGEGCPLGYSGTGTVTTTQLFDTPPYAIIKPVTKGRVFLYTVNGAVTTLVGVMEPTETLIQWKRYKVPVCAAWTATTPGYYIAIVKLAFIPSFNAYDPVIPGNIGALRFGLQALSLEDARDPAADTLWQKAKQLLANEVGDDTGAGADDLVQISDDFHVADISCGL